jgi:hypothetical protein
LVATGESNRKMSGRGRGRFNPAKYGNRSHGAGRGKPYKKENVKKTLNDYTFYVGSVKQASDYETTAEFIINHIRKTFDYGNDIGAALEELVPQDLSVYKPRMKVSSASKEDDKNAENRQFEIEYRLDYERWGNRENVYTMNLTKAYALLWERCSKGMQSKIEA